MRKMAAAALAAMMAVSVLTGCGSQTKESAAPAETAATAEETKAEGEESKTAASNTADSKFPEKNIKIIVPFDAGGGVDITCRVISEAAGKDYFNGHSLIVENMPGGGAIVGQTNVANAKADGYTMLAASAALVTNPIFNETSFKTSDFKAIAMVCFDPQCVVVPKDSPYNTLEEFVEAAKQGSLKMSTPGQSTSPHLAGVQMEQELGVKFDYLHTDSANMQLQQIMGNHSDCALMTAGEAASAAKDGSVKVLGVMSDERAETLPDVPTFKESGYNMVVGSFRGLAVPAGTPDDIVEVLDTTFGEIIQSDTFKEKMAAANMPVTYMNSTDFDKFLQDYAETMTRLKDIVDAQK